MDSLTIRTIRLILRDFRCSDLDAYRRLRSHPDFQRLYPAGDCSAERSGELLRMFLGWASEKPRLRFQLAIEVPGIGLLGSCGVRLAEEDPTEATFGCELGREHWGCGYATEAARALIGFAFAELGVHHIQAQTLSENSPAIALAQRLGMRVEVGPRSAGTMTLGVASSEWKT